MPIQSSDVMPKYPLNIAPNRHSTHAEYPSRFSIYAYHFVQPNLKQEDKHYVSMVASARYESRDGGQGYLEDYFKAEQWA